MFDKCTATFYDGKPCDGVQYEGSLCWFHAKWFPEFQRVKKDVQVKEED